MAEPRPSTPANETSRRSFLKSSTGAVVGGTLAANLVAPRGAHAAGDGTIRIGLIGCGGRGTGAARNALSAGQDIKLVAMGDAFDDRAKSSRNSLKNVFGDRVDVPDDRCFTGFDNYMKVLDSGVDCVLLATPPHFRPAHLRAAAEKGVHIFCEKPVAVDAPGVRHVMETCKLVQEKKLSLVSGLCWRYDTRVVETMDRIRDGIIGDVVCVHETYDTGLLWVRPRKEGMSDMEWQVRNWLYFNWLSGDHIVEQHIHSLDKGLWVLGDVAPVSAEGMGGRQVRTDPANGHIFDHHAVTFEFDSGAKYFSFCRQQANTYRDVSDYFLGTKGRCHINNGNGSVVGESEWKSASTAKNMYQAEHDALFESIRSGQPINNGDYMARSTMLAIMGRMATYTGQKITWDQALNSQEKLGPDSYEWGDLPVDPVAMPGQTPFV